jgi:UDP-N-acetyl-D-galactosamine dehydrogenase
MNLPALADIRIGVVGLGYLGLPLAIQFARHFPVLGSDIDPSPAESHAGLRR